MTVYQSGAPHRTGQTGARKKVKRYSCSVCVHKDFLTSRIGTKVFRLLSKFLDELLLDFVPCSLELIR